MKVLGLIFSSRAQGNCSRSIEYCLNKFKLKGYETETINIFNYNVQSCGDCDYNCFNSGECCKEDDVHELYRKCFESDKIIFAVPTYCGHLTSAYFKFWERSQALFQDEIDYENDYLKKMNFIIIGNLSSGGDMALHEALYSFTNRSFYPEATLLSSREYNKSSIKGDLIESIDVKNKLNNFAEKIINKI